MLFIYVSHDIIRKVLKKRTRFCSWTQQLPCLFPLETRNIGKEICIDVTAHRKNGTSKYLLFPFAFCPQLLRQIYIRCGFDLTKFFPVPTLFFHPLICLYSLDYIRYGGLSAYRSYARHFRKISSNYAKLQMHLGSNIFHLSIWPDGRARLSQINYFPFFCRDVLMNRHESSNLCKCFAPLIGILCQNTRPVIIRMVGKIAIYFLSTFLDRVQFVHAIHSRNAIS